MNDQFGDIEQESEQHRANIAHLVDELRSQITPAAIVNEVLGPEGGADLLRYVGYQVRKQVRKNPLPIGVIGVGVAWLLFADALRRQREIPLHDGLDYERYGEGALPSRAWILNGTARVIRTLSHKTAKVKQLSAGGQERIHMTTQTNGTGYSEHGDSTAESRQEIQLGKAALPENGSGEGSESAVARKAKAALAQTQQFATDLAQSAREKSGEAISGARDAVGDAASLLMERTNDMARKTKRVVSSRAANAGSSVGQLAREQPLLVAGVGFALGVALGVLLPLSRTENDLLGEQAEKLKDGASQLATEGYDKVKRVAQRTYDAATETLKDAAEEQGLTTATDDLTSGRIENDTQPSAGTGQAYGTDDGGDKSSTIYRH